ncbi:MULTISPECIES: hypothetical protein [unclassified Streptomyces]|uniref:hypothetical protein n=1 Tax=unclassified Streptomyces TaxID=2593676 RepID=UPI00115FEBA1|nr:MULTISPECIES: hypothetical protein [unclassified Streptomyces]
MKTRQTAAGIAASLEAACMLQSPETAAEMERLRARIADLESGLSLADAEEYPGELVHLRGLHGLLPTIARHGSVAALAQALTEHEAEAQEKRAADDRPVVEDPVVYTLTDAAVEMLAERAPAAAERHTPGTRGVAS